MINGLGVVGWGVGGIEAEAGMLGQPVYFLTPEVVGVNLTGTLKEGVTATDLVLRVTEMLRKQKVVGKFVEFFGEGAAALGVTDRATIANMAPEYGATMGFFGVDEETLAYLRGTGRSEENCAAFENYYKAQGLWGIPRKGEVDYTVELDLDLSTIVPGVAGPKRPRIASTLTNSAARSRRSSPSPSPKAATANPPKTSSSRCLCISMAAATTVPTCPRPDSTTNHLKEGEARNKERWSRIARPATTSRNSRPLQDGYRHRQRQRPHRRHHELHEHQQPERDARRGLLAKKAVEKGLKVNPAVKTSLGPGSRVVTDYLEKTGLQPYFDKLGFQTVGYGCTTCIGNSGPLHPRWKTPSRRTTSWPPACSRAIATLKPACTRTSARTSSCPRRSSWPSPSRARSTST